MQEWLQGKIGKTPSYRVVGQEGPDHAPVFRVQVHAEGLEPMEGRGGSRQNAEKAAASAMLLNLGKCP